VTESQPGRGSGCYGCDADNEIGLRLRVDRVEGEPRARGTWVPDAGHQGPKMHLHGGVSSTLLDEAMARLAHLLDGRHSITAKLEVRFRKPVPLDGQPLTVEAWREVEPPEASRRHKLFARLSLADGTPAVEAEGLFVRLPAS
jgi:acyl-coenzyme A thioesterase PaaI-like protein